MCLTSRGKTFRPRTLREDKIVYKHVISQGSSYLTSYQYMEVEIGEKYTSNVIINKNVKQVGPKGTITETKPKSVIHTGLHSFAKLKDAKYWAEVYSSSDMVKEVVVRCIIPKGSIICSGTFNTVTKKYDAFVSDTIIYEKVLS